MDAAQPSSVSLGSPEQQRAVLYSSKARLQHAMMMMNKRTALTGGEARPRVRSTVAYSSGIASNAGKASPMAVRSSGTGWMGFLSYIPMAAQSSWRKTTPLGLGLGHNAPSQMPCLPSRRARRHFSLEVDAEKPSMQNLWWEEGAPVQSLQIACR